MAVLWNAYDRAPERLPQRPTLVNDLPTAWQSGVNSTGNDTQHACRHGQDPLVGSRMPSSSAHTLFIYPSYAFDVLSMECRSNSILVRKLISSIKSLSAMT